MRTSESEAPPGSVGELARHVVTVGLAGLVAGFLVGGLGGRLFMRIVASTASPLVQGATTEAGASIGEITAEGSVGLIMFVGVFSGMIGAFFFATFRPWLQWTGRYLGLAFGVVLIAVGSASSDMLNPDNPDFFLLGNGVFVVSLIFVLFLAFGVVITSAYRQLDKRLPGADRAPRVARTYIILGAIGFVLVFDGGLTVLFGSNVCGCEPPVVAGLFVVLVVMGTLLFWASGISTRFAKMKSAARILGFLGLAGAAGFGLARAISDAITVISSVTF